jgi:leucyl-tRNA synthetase
LRHLDNKNANEPFDTEWIDRMGPVDLYVGGPEHATMHLLYARFITKALRDMGRLHFDEPFKRLVHQGMILGPDGQKMSKSNKNKNTISPDTYIEKYGSDAFRLYLGFGFAYSEGGPWSDDGIKAASRFISRVERMSERFNAYARERNISAALILEKIARGADPLSDSGGDGRGASEKELLYASNYAIKSASADIERFQFNTAISRAMELLNAINKYDSDVPDADKDGSVFAAAYMAFIRLIAPFAPHFCEELWEGAGLPYSIFARGNWPEYHEGALKRDMVEMAVQVNGTVRFKIETSRDSKDAEFEELVKHDDRLAPFLASAGSGGMPATIEKIIVVRGRLVSVVAK